jgi:hypothetical protein
VRGVSIAVVGKVDNDNQGGVILDGSPSHLTSRFAKKCLVVRPPQDTDAVPDSPPTTNGRLRS